MPTGSWRSSDECRSSVPKPLTDAGHLLCIGLYPIPFFLYAAFQESRLSPSALESDLRKLRMFAGFFEGLRDSVGCGSTDSLTMDEAAVNEFLIWMRDQGLRQSTAEGYLKVLNSMLSLFGNHVVDEKSGESFYRLLAGRV